MPLVNGIIDLDPHLRRSRQRFGKTDLSALNSSCTQLFDWMGNSAMISLPAATTIAVIATCSAVMSEM